MWLKLVRKLSDGSTSGRARIFFVFCCVSLRFCETHLLLELQVVGVENERWKCKEHFAYTTRRCWRLNTMAWDFLPVAQVLNNSPASDIERQWMVIPWSIYSPILGGEFKDFLNRNLGIFVPLWLVFLSWNSPRISWFPLGCNCDAVGHVCFTSRGGLGLGVHVKDALLPLGRHWGKIHIQGQNVKPCLPKDVWRVLYKYGRSLRPTHEKIFDLTLEDVDVDLQN